MFCLPLLLFFFWCSFRRKFCRPFLGRTYFSIAFKTGVLWHVPSVFVGEIFNLSFSKDNFAGYRILDWSFFFQCFNYFTSLSSVSHGFWRNVWCNSYPHSFIGQVFPFLLLRLTTFKTFSLSLIFCSLNMINILVFIPLHVLWDSWICSLVSANKFWGILSNYFLNILLLSLFWCSCVHMLRLLKLAHVFWMF